ncbi:hypothetical protein Enr13x_34730 [Stieleria neptunia]|uniref:Uncharacterized protein n=1 Tax=Stieleria neptunia TaxID=2527979 RepID=A0A518HRY7_9BACT|nr:hypothetical protein Enr13x_34730 [Stieleria neptunia]
MLHSVTLQGPRDVARGADGRGPPTRLLPRILERFQIASPNERIPILYSKPTDHSSIDRLAIIVVASARIVR